MNIVEKAQHQINQSLLFLYQSGLSIGDIAKQVSLSRPAVMERLYKANYTPRTRNQATIARKRRNILLNKAIDLINRSEPDGEEIQLLEEGGFVVAIATTEKASSELLDIAKLVIPAYPVDAALINFSHCQICARGQAGEFLLREAYDVLSDLEGLDAG